ncbi:Txe/YoeB family addiction module toxin [Arsenicibacter rosenii]|uniref:Putative mRNA interferase YoeB n=1 Tax=Arsenicibacter rosenii TaxID=1750698 RepID=A0A1S2VEY7_9BACT|nr:Txe/YoeB family addiction module toxin [Arsenicibacter rosenii]OIN56980.1 toxin YoeB [Arsenicibacter rosenii]
MRFIRFDPDGWDEFTGWNNRDRKVWLRIVELLNEVQRNPFSGKGKPEPLKHQYKGYWSRRITDEHRLIYKVTDEDITVISCVGHY